MSSESLKLPQKILESEVKAICKRYRIDPEEARRILEDNFAGHPNLMCKVLDRHPEEDVTRFSDYKEVIKKTKKQVYYHLRQYQADKEKVRRLKKQLDKLIRTSTDYRQVEQVITELLLTHVSTRERFPHYQTFYRALFDLVAPPQTIIDIGCGIHPLSYPFDRQAQRPEIYVAMDKAPDVVEILTIFAPYVMPTRIVPVCDDIAQAEWADYLLNGHDTFDLALMLKLIPVIHRQNRKLLGKLAEVPARRILITASTEAMTRREDIVRREDRILREFGKMTEREVVGIFRIENEFGYLLG